jgi:hypothetical protein
MVTEGGRLSTVDLIRVVYFVKKIFDIKMS